MASKFFIVAIAQVLLVQAAFSQNIGRGSLVTGNTVVQNEIYIDGAYSSGSAGFGAGSAIVGPAIGVSGGLGLAGSRLGASSVGSINLAGNRITSGGPLLVTAISPIGPSGLAVASENVIEANLLVTGQLPFLSAVAFEGALPTAGSGVATCGCGNGAVGITSEGVGRPGIWY